MGKNAIEATVYTLVTVACPNRTTSQFQSANVAFIQIFYWVCVVSYYHYRRYHSLSLFWAPPFHRVDLLTASITTSCSTFNPFCSLTSSVQKHVRSFFFFFFIYIFYLFYFILFFHLFPRHSLLLSSFFHRGSDNDNQSEIVVYSSGNVFTIATCVQ